MKKGGKKFAKHIPLVGVVFKPEDIREKGPVYGTADKTQFNHYVQRAYQLEANLNNCLQGHGMGPVAWPRLYKLPQ